MDSEEVAAGREPIAVDELDASFGRCGRRIGVTKPKPGSSKSAGCAGSGFAAMAFFRAREVLEAAVKLLHLPAHVHRVENRFSAQVCRQVVGNDPFNAAACGNPLE